MWMDTGNRFRPTEAPRLEDYRNWTDDQVFNDLSMNPNAPETVPRIRDVFLNDPQRGLRIMASFGTAGSFRPELWALALEHLGHGQTRMDCIRLLAGLGN